MSELGDLTNFLKEGAVVDLSWLDVDENAYRELDALPKQNLDVSPDLQAMWAHEDKPASAYLVPNTGAPRTMGDLSTGHGKLAAEVEASIAKVARYALMQSIDSTRFREALTSRFDMGVLKAARHVIKEALDERGLLGRYYIDATDFPGCHNSPKNAVTFVRKFASESKFVRAKSECGTCIHAKTNSTGGMNCAVFHKEVVLEVPYTDQLAAKVEQAQRARGYVVEASTDSAKKRVKLAMLSSIAEQTVSDPIKPVVNPVHFLRPVSGVQEVVHVARDISAIRVATQNTVEAFFKEGRLTVEEAQQAFQMVSSATTEEELNGLVEKIASFETVTAKSYDGPVMTTHAMLTNIDSVTAGLTRRDVVKTASRYMNEGLYGVELLEALKKRFDKRDLVAARDDLKSVIAEQGLQGIYYLDPTVYNDYGKGCNEAERLHRSRLVPYVKLGSACASCVHNHENRCSKINKPLVVEPPYVNKAAQQRQILASGVSTSVPYEAIVNNGLTMMQEFELQKAATEVELTPAPKNDSFEIAFGTGKVKL
jgi:hypothetical protein